MEKIWTSQGGKTKSKGKTDEHTFAADYKS